MINPNNIKNLSEAEYIKWNEFDIQVLENGLWKNIGFDGSLIEARQELIAIACVEDSPCRVVEISTTIEVETGKIVEETCVQKGKIRNAKKEASK